jgi:RNA polymerase sigma-70 factor (ECF subfamily)
MEARDDVRHIDEVLNGNTSSFAVLVERYQDMVYTIAVKVLQNREDAEEVAQDAFVKAFHKLGTFRKEARFSTWLYRIAFNEAISRSRLRKLPEVEFNEGISESAADEEVEENIIGLDPEEQKKIVGKVLKRFAESDQLLVSLYYYEGLHMNEIAEITGLSESNVKVRLHRLRKRIFKELNEILSRKTYSF